MRILWCCLLMPLALTACSKQSQSPKDEKGETQNEGAIGIPTPLKNDELTNSIGIKLKLIPKGSFKMGSKIGEKTTSEIAFTLESWANFVMGLPAESQSPGQDEEQFEATLSQDYFLGVFEVTQEQYKQVMGINPSRFQGNMLTEGDSSLRPVEQVSWHDAVEFCEKLSQLPEEKKAGRVYRLPTEAEWEYACRSGSQTDYSFGESARTLGQYAWHGGNSNDQSHPVGQKLPNPWGLYDMHGNVEEWCADWYADYPKEPTTDPGGPKIGEYRVFRGGAWCYETAVFRSAERARLIPEDKSTTKGFRVAMNVTASPNESKP